MAMSQYYLQASALPTLPAAIKVAAAQAAAAEKQATEEAAAAAAKAKQVEEEAKAKQTDTASMKIDTDDLQPQPSRSKLAGEISVEESRPHKRPLSPTTAPPPPTSSAFTADANANVVLPPSSTVPHPQSSDSFLESLVLLKKARVEDEDNDVIYVDEDAPPPPPSPEGPSATLGDDQATKRSSHTLLFSDWCPSLGATTTAAAQAQTTAAAAALSRVRTFPLPDFSLQPPTSTTNKNGCNTLNVRLTIPSNWKRWAMNICPPDTKDGVNVLLHFNPREKNRDLMLTDRQGTWGMNIKRKVPDSLASGMVDVTVQIRTEGFLISVNNKVEWIFHHRRDISNLRELCLVLPGADDMGVLETVTYHRIWWGWTQLTQHPLISRFDSSHARYYYLTDRTVFFRGIPETVVDPVEVFEWEKACGNVFAEFESEGIALVPGKGCGYIRLRDVESVATAIEDWDGVELEYEGVKYPLTLSVVDWR